ncbi:hypothetical protein [Prosthecobacter sp.]|uniref:hypothetical protein n=1 Tax=Prosthecobacter sp. TaxID=1965333 RepID=UPI0037835D2F
MRRRPASKSLDPSPCPSEDVAASVPAPELGILHSEGEVRRLMAGKGRVNAAQMAEVLARISSVMADYLEGGRHIEVVLNPVEILSAVDAALQEAEGRPSPWPDGADARTFFVHGLYEELVQQPSNLFQTRVFPDGSERYIPLDKGTWKACLKRLREQIVRSGSQLGRRGGKRG